MSEAACAVQVAHARHYVVERRLHERIAGLHADNRHQVRCADGGVAFDVHLVDEVPRPAHDGEADGHLAGRPRVSRVACRDVAVAARVEVLFDGTARVLEQILVGGRLLADRHEALAFGLGQRIAVERDRDVRAAIDGHAQDRAAVDEVHRVRRARLVEAARAQRVLILLQLRIGLRRVVGPSRRDAAVGECAAIRGIFGVDVDAADRRARPGVDLEHHRGAIGLVRDLDARGNHRHRVAAFAVHRLERSRDLVRARGGRRLAEPLEDLAAKNVLRHAEHAAELDAIHGMHGHEDVAQPHAAGGLILVDLHVLVAREADQMRDRLAHIRDRQRHADVRLHEAEHQRIGDRLTFLLHVDADDCRRQCLRRGPSWKEEGRSEK